MLTAGKVKIDFNFGTLVNLELQNNTSTEDFCSVISTEAFILYLNSKNMKSRVPRALPVGEWEFTRRVSSEACKIEAGATGYDRRVSTIPIATIFLEIHGKILWSGIEYVCIFLWLDNLLI